MIIPTHRLVGKHIYKKLDEPSKNKLDYKRFVWGNVKPDLFKKYKRVSHYHPANEAYVFELLENIMNPNLSKNEFSAQHGILIHFLCDYTCIYHNNMTINKSHSMKEHMIYEYYLHLLTRGRIKQAFPRIIKFTTIDDIKYHIWQVINRANLEGIIPDVKADFEDMMCMSMSVTQFLVESRVCNASTFVVKLNK